MRNFAIGTINVLGIDLLPKQFKYRRGASPQRSPAARPRSPAGSSTLKLPAGFQEPLRRPGVQFSVKVCAWFDHQW